MSDTSYERRRRSQEKGRRLSAIRPERHGLGPELRRDLHGEPPCWASQKGRAPPETGSATMRLPREQSSLLVSAELRSTIARKGTFACGVFNYSLVGEERLSVS